jgi:integrase
MTITGWLNAYARVVGTARPWKFSTHQFRKTFARFVAMGDKSGLLALKQHFKHVSIAMTDRYVGRDLELLDLVASEKQEELGRALDELLVQKGGGLPEDWGGRLG